MKINLCVDEREKDVSVTITCHHLTPAIEKLLAALRMMDQQFMVKKGEETHLLDLSSIIYIESVDRTCFVYTKDHVYETAYKLYELEQQLSIYGFCRISKSCIIHMHHIQSLKTDINHKIRLTLGNGEQLLVSRQYSVELKKRLGVI